MAAHDLLDIVSENDEVIRTERRDTVHRQGLLHREVHICLYTSDGKIIFQHRAKDKDTWPDKLDVTAGGHVDSGMSYEETAVKELKEETGLEIDYKQLELVTVMRNHAYDETTGLENNVIRYVYAMRYDEPVEGLRVEEGKAQGFEAHPIQSVLEVHPGLRGRLISGFFEEPWTSTLKAIQKLI